MPKLLKQLLLFIIFVAAISGLTALITRRAATFNTATLVYGSVDDIRNQITTEWDNRNGWDLALYDNQLSLIAQSHAAGIINVEARLTLTDRVHQEAWQSCVKAMDSEWAKRNCNVDTINFNHSGLESIILRRPSIEQLPNVTRALATHRIYRNILAFNNNPLGLNPRFNFDKNRPTNDFNAYERSIQARKSSLMGDKYYSRISHINDVARIHSTQVRLNEAKQKYLSALESQIRQAYNSAARDARSDNDNAENQLNQLKADLFNLRSYLYNQGYTSIAASLSSLSSSL